MTNPLLTNVLQNAALHQNNLDPALLKSIVEVILNEDGYRHSITARQWAIDNIEPSNAEDTKEDWWAGETGKWKIIIQFGSVRLLITEEKYAAIAILALPDVNVEIVETINDLKTKFPQQKF